VAGGRLFYRQAVVDNIFYFIYFTFMQAALFQRDKILLLAIWSFFSFSVIKFFSIFLYSISHFFLWYTCLYSLLFFLYYFVFKIRFAIGLNYLQYTVSNILFSVLVILFSYAYYKVIMLDNDFFDLNFFIMGIISNLLLGSFLFLFTLIKKK